MISVLVAVCVLAGWLPKTADCAQAVTEAVRPPGFVDLHQVDPAIPIDIRYAGSHNFVGHPVPGYEAARCVLTRPAADALIEVARQLNTAGLSLKLYDCYRPQTAVAYFVRWAADPGDAAMKAEFYPRTAKRDLIARGYIASPSSHSRGSTVDLTVIGLPPSATSSARPPAPVSCIAPAALRFADGSLDMGTGYDCFDVMAHVDTNGLSDQQRANRLLLRTLMVQAGFAPYPYEWWHFTLRHEPFPKTYFSFPVR